MVLWSKGTLATGYQSPLYTHSSQLGPRGICPVSKIQDNAPKSRCQSPQNHQGVFWGKGLLSIIYEMQTMYLWGTVIYSPVWEFYGCSGYHARRKACHHRTWHMTARSWWAPWLRVIWNLDEEYCTGVAVSKLLIINSFKNKSIWVLVEVQQGKNLTVSVRMPIWHFCGCGVGQQLQLQFNP